MQTRACSQYVLVATLWQGLCEITSAVLDQGFEAHVHNQLGSQSEQKQQLQHEEKQVLQQVHAFDPLLLSPGHFGFPEQLKNETSLARFQETRHEQPCVLGSGATAQVWKAYDAEEHRWVALKFLLGHHPNSNGYATRDYLTNDMVMKDIMHKDGSVFGNIENKLYAERECSRVQHVMSDVSMNNAIGKQRICQCFEGLSSVAEAPLYLVHEFCGSTTLWDADHGLSLTRIREVMLEIFQGLQFLSMHDPPLVHHDIKPDNIALMDGGHAKIIDFGGAVFFDEAGQVEKHSPCTPGFAPPEIDGCPPNFQFFAPEEPASDLFSRAKRALRRTFFPTLAPSWAFDAHSAGATYYFLLCRGTLFKRRRQTNTWDWCELPLGAQDDRQLVEGLLLDSPINRTSPATAIEKLDLLIGSTRT